MMGPVHWLSAEVLPYAVAVSFISVFYLFPYYAALRETDTSVVAALFSLERVFVPLWAYLIVGEVVKPSQYVGFGRGLHFVHTARICGVIRLYFGKIVRR